MLVLRVHINANKLIALGTTDVPLDPADHPFTGNGPLRGEGGADFRFVCTQFTVCDRWFAALPTGTQANRLMAMSGSSSIVDNAPVFLPDQELVYDWLSAHEVNWCAYQSGDFFPFFSLMPRWLPEILTSLAASELGVRGRFRRYSKFREHWLSDDAMPSVILC